MKLLKIANYYKSFYPYYYRKYPHIKKRSFKEQHAHLMSQYVGWSDFYSKALQRKGFDAYEIVFNAVYVQNKWAEEHNVEGNALDILSAQIRFYMPDIIWFQDSFSFNKEFILKIKKIAPSVKLLIGNACAPYTQENIRNLKVFDFITTCSPGYVEEFNRLGLKSLLLYHAFEPSILSDINLNEKIRDFIFVGSIIPRKGFHIERKGFLEQVAANQSINFSYFGNLANTRYSEVLKQQLLYVAKEVIQKAGLSRFFQNSVKFKKVESLNAFPKYFKFSKELKKCYSGELFGIDMFREVARSKATIDLQIPGCYLANMRMFEAAGVGSCLLLENRANI